MSTIAVLTSNENGADSLTDINNNFSNLNTDKLEGAGTATYVPFYSGSNTLTSDAHFSYNSTTDVLHVHKISGDGTDGLLIESDNGTDVGILGAANTANATWYGSHNFSAATQDTIAGFTGAGKTLGSLATATYPSLTELSYVKGVTSALQTQINAKGTVTDVSVTTANGVSGTVATSTTTPAITLTLGAITPSSVTTTGNIELGDASDTTIARVSAGVVSIEGKNILTTDGGTLTGNITLGENTSIALDPAGSADGKYSGITVTGTAGYTQAFGDLVYLDPTDSRWEATDANSASGADGDARGILGMVVSAGTDGNACTILLNGVIRADANFPALTVNAPVYVAETSGDIVVTRPSTSGVVIRVVGFALTTDEIYFNPDPGYITQA